MGSPVRETLKFGFPYASEAERGIVFVGIPPLMQAMRA
jgi:hypothetical protein